MTSLKRVGLSLAAAAALTALAIGSSSASSLTNPASFTWTSDGCTGGCSPSGTVTATASGADLTISATLGGTLDFLSGNGNGIDTSFTFDLAGVSSITILNTVANPLTAAFSNNAGAQSAGSLKMDGEGTYNFGLKCNTCSPSAPDGNTLTFTITSGTLTGLQLLADLTGEGPDGAFFAADVTNGTNTGAIDATATHASVTPLPGAAFLFGSVLFGGLGVAKWRKNRKGPVSIIA